MAKNHTYRTKSHTEQKVANGRLNYSQYVLHKGPATDNMCDVNQNGHCKIVGITEGAKKIK